MFDVADASATLTALLIDPKESTVEAVEMAADSVEVEVNRILGCIFTAGDDLAGGLRVISDKNAAFAGIHAFVEITGCARIFAGKVVLFSLDEAGLIISMAHSVRDTSDILRVVVPVLDPVYEGAFGEPENGIRLHGKPLDGFRVRLRRSRPLVK